MWPFKNKENNKPVKAVAVSDLEPYTYNGQIVNSPFENSLYDGGKFFGGFGATQLQQLDYWTLRHRSAQLFNENLYARGLIRRLITNEINTGLTPELCPDEDILGKTETWLNEWTERVETRFGLWGKNKFVCDWEHRLTFGGLQRAARAEALISGDVLVVLRQSPKTRLPAIKLVSGNSVQTPLMTAAGVNPKHKITHGVERDKKGRIVAYWVLQKDNLGSKRIPAFGEKSGRRMAWLVYGTDKRMDDVRGVPLLSILLQSLKEIDRYRDATQRKMALNATVAMFVKKTENKVSSLPVTGGATRKDTASVTDGDGTARNFDVNKYIPGIVMEELQQGEEPVAFSNSGDATTYGIFEEAIIQACAWASEVPPEILKLAFSNNYSASQAAINEFKIYLNLVWCRMGEEFCSPILEEWMVNETLLGNIVAPGFLESWRNPREYAVFGAWTFTDWYGSIKPSTDMLKQAKGAEMLLKMGLTTRAREARTTTGTKYTRNIKRLKQENELLAAALKPILELKQKFGVSIKDNENKAVTKGEMESAINDLIEMVENGGTTK